MKIPAQEFPPSPIRGSANNEPSCTVRSERFFSVHRSNSVLCGNVVPLNAVGSANRTRQSVSAKQSAPPSRICKVVLQGLPGLFDFCDHLFFGWRQLFGAVD